MRSPGCSKLVRLCQAVGAVDIHRGWPDSHLLWLDARAGQVIQVGHHGYLLEQCLTKTEKPWLLPLDTTTEPLGLLPQQSCVCADTVYMGNRFSAGLNFFFFFALLLAI